MNCQRRRSGPSFEVDAAPTPVRNGPGRPRGEPGADRREPGTSPGRTRNQPGRGLRRLPPARPGRSASAGAPRTIRFRRRAPDDPLPPAQDDPDDPSPATARRAVVIGLQPAANGRGCGLCV